jgi:hypothetical protein
MIKNVVHILLFLNFLSCKMNLTTAAFCNNSSKHNSANDSSISSHYLRSVPVRYASHGKCQSSSAATYASAVVPGVGGGVPDNDERVDLQSNNNNVQLRQHPRLRASSFREKYNTKLNVRSAASTDTDISESSSPSKSGSTLYLLVIGGCLLILVCLLSVAAEIRERRIEAKKYEWRSKVQVLVQHDF